METVEKNTDTPTKNRKPFKIIAGVILGLVVLLLLMALAVPSFLSSAGGRQFLVGRINNSVDGQLGMDTFSMGWLSGIKLTNLSYESDDGATQVKVGRVESQPRYAALLGGRVDLGKTVIDQPQVYMKVLPPHEQPAKESPKPRPKDRGETPFALPVEKIDLEVLNGNATIELTDALAQTQRVTFKNIASNVQLNQPGVESRMLLSADITGDNTTGSLKAQGAVTPPKKGWTLEDTDGDFKVTISKLDLQTLRPLLAMAGQDVQMGGLLDADADVQIRKGAVESLNAEAVVAGFSQGTGDQKMTFAEPVTLSAQTGMKDDAVRIDKLNIKAPFCTVNVTGGTEVLDYTVNADLAKTYDFAKQFTGQTGYGMAGRLSASGRLNLAEGNLAAAGKATIQELLLSKDANRAPQTDVSLEYDVAIDNVKKQLNVAATTLATSMGTIAIRDLSMAMDAEGTPPINLTAQITALDLAKAWPYAQMLGGADPQLLMAGTLNAALSVQTKEDIMRVKAEKTNIQQLRIGKADTPPFVQEQVSLTADVTLDLLKQSIGIQAFDMQGKNGQTLIKITQGSKIQQSSSKGIKKMDADIEAEYDLQTLSGVASPFLPQGLKVEGKRKDRFTASSSWPEKDPDKMMANLNANGKLGFSRAEYQGLKFGPTELKLNVAKGQAAIDMPDADVNGGKVRFAGDINLAQTPKMLKLRAPAQVVENIKIDDVIGARLLQYLHPAFANASGVSGTANLSCDTLAIPLGGGTPQDINLAGNVGLTDVRLNSPIIGLLSGAFRSEPMNLFSIPSSAFTVQKGYVQYPDMPMVFSESFALHFGGTIGLMDNSLKMQIKAPYKGQTYTIPLAGTLDKPQPDLTKLVLSNITDQIPLKDEKTKEAIDTGRQILEGIFKREK
jgi:hypothetical protein